MALRPGNNDKAWNDPPVFAYQTGGPPKAEDGNSAAPKRNLLNKRVAFPLAGGDPPVPSAVLPAWGGLPAPPPPSLPPAVPSVLSPTQASSPMSHNQQQASSVVPASLLTVSQVLDKHRELLAADRQDDIAKRLDNLYTSWNAGKLNEDIQQRLSRLCGYLEDKDFTSAESVQVSLAVDYTAECSNWIVALKYVLSELKNKL